MVEIIKKIPLDSVSVDVFAILVFLSIITVSTGFTLIFSHEFKDKKEIRILGVILSVLGVIMFYILSHNVPEKEKWSEEKIYKSEIIKRKFFER